MGSLMSAYSNSIQHRSTFSQPNYTNLPVADPGAASAFKLALGPSLNNTQNSTAAKIGKDGMISGLGIINDRAKNLEHGKLSKIKALVLHRTDSGNYNRPSNTSVGAHFYIDKNGDVYQTASLNKYTHHVGKVKSRCMAEDTCTGADQKKIQSFGWSPKKISDHEKTKEYPARYPINQESIGIEVVGKYSKGTDSWEPVTAGQKKSLNQLVDFLEDKYKLSASDRFPHENISYKTAGEGSVVEKVIVDK